ncbi:protein TALPID3 isoform 2-T2 [Menidia menidia]
MLRSSPRDPLRLDAGDVFIRPTRVLPTRRVHEPPPEARSVQITVQKLGQPHRPEQEGGEQKPWKRPGSGKPAAGSDLQMSRFTAGERGVGLGALKERSHSSSRKREVKVQLLPQRPLQTATGPQTPPAQSLQDPAVVRGARTSSGCPGDPSTAAAAAATAAALSAAAPILKAQSDIEARMSQLADGVQKLLHTNREDQSKERSVSQQALQHLETLHGHQLQLQSQLLESALKIVTGHAVTTSDVSSSKFSTTNVNNQHPSVSGCPAAATTVKTVPVAVETCNRPKHSRDDSCRQNKPIAESSHPPSVACHSQEAVRQANEMLKKMGRLNNEMKKLLTPEDSPQFPKTAPDPQQVQQQKGTPGQVQTHQNRVQQSHALQNHLPQNNSQNNYVPFQALQDQHLQCHQNQFQNLQFQQTTKSQQNRFPSPHSLFHRENQSPSVHSRPVGSSVLEEAGQVLRQVQRQKKVLEENLEALMKAKTGEILHCQLEALAANRDWTEEVQIKKTVDTWINTFSNDLQAPHPGKSSVAADQSRPADTGTSQQAAAGRGKPAGMLRATGTKPVMGRGSRAGHRTLQETKPDRVTGKKTDTQQVDADLSRTYGKVPYEGQRRTLKKNPYLHFSSPASPPSRKPRPRLVESIRGVRLRSCKTQTSPLPSLGQAEQHHEFSTPQPASLDPVHLTTTLTDSSPVAIAIPLGRPRMDSSKRERTQEVTLVPPARPQNIEVTTDNRTAEPQKRLDADKAPSAPSHGVLILERASEENEENEENEEDEEGDIFPGNDTLHVADINLEEENEMGDGVIVLDGDPSPTPAAYHGPAFPPVALSSHPTHNETAAQGISQQQNVLENRMVEWLSQHLLSRMIADIYQPPVSDPTMNQNDQTSHSELEERSTVSDIVEAAAGGSLEPLVETTVDSELMRQLVKEVLSETVAQVLGQKDALDGREDPGLEQPEPEPTAYEEEEQVPLVPTPVPTPLPSEVRLSTETPPVTTPTPSKPSSPLNMEPPELTTAPEPVTTPATTPEPHFAERNASLVSHSSPLPIWGDSKRTVDEEKPEDHVETQQTQLVMSIEEEEPHPSSPVHPPSPPPPLSPAPAEGSLEPSSSSTEDSSSSRSTVTAETEAALNHISEGELLISVSQQAPLTEEEAFGSFSSSLQEVLDMDLDPPTVEQIHGHHLLLTLVTKMNQGVTHKEARRQPEGSWGMEDEMEEDVSVGEVRDCETTKPIRTRNPAQQDRTRNAAAGHQGEEEEEDGQHRGSTKKKKHLLSIRPQEEEEEDVLMDRGEPLSTYTDSSSNDVF